MDINPHTYIFMEKQLVRYDRDFFTIKYYIKTWFEKFMLIGFAVLMFFVALYGITTGNVFSSIFNGLCFILSIVSLNQVKMIPTDGQKHFMWSFDKPWHKLNYWVSMIYGSICWIAFFVGLVIGISGSMK